MVNLSEALASKALEVQYDDLPEDVRHWAKVSILDTFGVMLAGGAQPAVHMLERVIGGSPGACICVLSGRNLMPLDAALLNGMAAHILDFDASNATFSGHPVPQLLPAVYAAAEIVGADGKSLLAAYVAGFEVQSRIARGIDTAHFERGWFNTSAIGVFGAAAGACHLLGLDLVQTRHAIGMAAMMASGSVAHAGSMAKPLGAGHAARSGLMAALAAREGLTAAEDGIGDRRGYLSLVVGSGSYDKARILKDWGSPYDIVETATGIKQHPCCGQFHTAIDTLRSMMESDFIRSEDVREVDLRIRTTRLAHTNRPDPRTGTDAKFSIQYCIARTLIDGAPLLHHFEEAAIHEPQVRALMQQIKPSIHPDTPPDAPLRAQGAVDITVTLKDGRQIVGTGHHPFGRIPGHPLPQRMLHAKFLTCLDNSMFPSAGRPLLDAIVKLEQQNDVRAISSLLR